MAMYIGPQLLYGAQRERRETKRAVFSRHLTILQRWGKQTMKKIAVPK